MKAPVKPITIDILQTELDQDLPHWLSPQQRFAGKHDERRKEIRARHHAEKRAKRKK